ncbi:MAG TPA: tetratricopeptide repeat protein [Ignavibacteriales bacterium]|nr:tetratricopeptide repeat protein [Ignavibacteriales bacterium]
MASRYLLSCLGLFFLSYILSGCGGEPSNNKKKEALQYAEKGLTYAQMGNFSKAVENTKEAIDIWPNHAEFYHSLGLIYGSAGDYAESNSCYQKALELKPNYPECYKELADNHKILGNQGLSDVYYKQYLDLSKKK